MVCLRVYGVCYVVYPMGGGGTAGYEYYNQEYNPLRPYLGSKIISIPPIIV